VEPFDVFLARVRSFELFLRVFSRAETATLFCPKSRRFAHCQDVESGAKARTLIKRASAEDRGSAIWSFTSDTAGDALKMRSACTSAFQDHCASQAQTQALAQVYGELVSNVVRHAPGRITILLELDGTTARLVVSDCGTGIVPQPKLPADPLSESGRGLFIAAQLAAELHITRNAEGGSLVCAAIPCRNTNQMATAGKLKRSKVRY
jgi:anti-sigma regulatory factor (Ser/Thr protein kinase)